MHCSCSTTHLFCLDHDTDRVNDMVYAASMVDIDALIVEPSPVQAKILTRELEELGVLSIHATSTGGEALEMMRDQPPTVVISSMYLPDMSGTELVQTMRAEEALETIAFVLVSSETRPQHLEGIRQSGVCGILPKPFKLDQMEIALKAALRLQLGEHDEKDFEGNNYRVLLVDDMKSARKFMRLVLEKLGFTDIIEATDGLEAVQQLEEQMVDLIVTDFNMPNMNGKDLTEHVRTKSWQSSVPILMVTSEENNARLAAVEESGVSGICDKPFDPTNVSNLLHDMLGEAPL